MITYNGKHNVQKIIKRIKNCKSSYKIKKKKKTNKLFFIEKKSKICLKKNNFMIVNLFLYSQEPELNSQDLRGKYINLFCGKKKKLE